MHYDGVSVIARFMVGYILKSITLFLRNKLRFNQIEK